MGIWFVSLYYELGLFINWFQVNNQLKLKTISQARPFYLAHKIRITT